MNVGNIETKGRPLAILVVEDETLVAMNLESILQDLGHNVVGPIMHLRDLDALIDAGLTADAAILDINIAGQEIFPHAQRIADAGIPIIFATGYGSNGLRDNWQGRPVIPKPYTDFDVAAGLSALANSA